jgi:hypothetical protein
MGGKAFWFTVIVLAVVLVAIAYFAFLHPTWIGMPF